MMSNQTGARLFLSLTLFIMAAIAIIIRQNNDKGFHDYQSQIIYYYLGCIILSLTLFINIIALLSLNRRVPLWINPIVLLGGWLLIAYAGPGWLSLNDPKYNIDFVNLGVLSLPQLPNALLLISATYAIVSGTFHALSVFLKSDRSQRSWLSRMNPTPIYFLYGLSVIVRVWIFSKVGISYGADSSALGGAGAIMQWLSYIADLRFIALSALIILSRQRVVKPSVPVLILVIEILYGLGSGMIKPVFFTLIVASLSYALSGVAPLRINRKGTRKTFAVILMTAVCLIFGIYSIGISEGIRQVVNQPGVKVNSFERMTHVLGIAHNLTWGESFSNGMEIAMRKMGDRQAGVLNSVGVILNRIDGRIPDRKFEGMQDIYNAPLYMVPRVLWKDKPIFDVGYNFSVNWLNFPRETSNSAAMSWTGSGYISNGIVGLVVVSIVIGSMIGIIYSLSINSGSVVVYVSMLPVILNFEGDFTTTFLTLLQQFVFFSVVWWSMTLLRASETQRKMYS